MNEIKNYILNKMTKVLNNAELNLLREVLDEVIPEKNTIISNDELFDAFITAKSVEGCSERTIKYYTLVLKNFFAICGDNIMDINTEDIRKYLNDYQIKNNCSKVSLDNIRRVLSTFFNWLEEEDYIRKSPVKRIHKIKTIKTVKEIYSADTLQLLKDSTCCARDLAIVNVLISTGMRVGELVRLNINDVDLENKECVVLGKGNKQRKVYFDSETKIHLKEYLEERNDNNEALFVSKLRPNDRLNISGVEILIKRLGTKIGVKKVHPHKFRRTLATNAIGKGMPVEQVQHLLGHSKIDTTMQYAMVDQSNVRISYRKYID